MYDRQTQPQRLLNFDADGTLVAIRLEVVLGLCSLIPTTWASGEEERSWHD